MPGAAATRRLLAPVLAAAALVGCSRPVTPARTHPLQPVSPAEAAASDRRAHERRCRPAWALLFPGLGQACIGKDADAVVLGSLGAAEIGTAVAVAQRRDVDHPGVSLPLLALSDLWLYGYIDTKLDENLADRALYAPPDTLADLVAAPFNIQVLKRPEVWAGTLVMLASGVAVSMLADGELPDTDRVGDDPNVFGETLDPRAGYPIAVATGVGLFSHVAIAEEAMFRGALQSGIARHAGENAGHLWSSAIFGLAHAPNALSMPEGQRARYLLIGVPFITAGGAYLGWVYRRGDYSLAPPVAAHFWYNLLLSATFFVLDPQDSPISANVSLRF